MRELDVLEHLDEAVAAGVRCTPSIVVHGRVRLAGTVTEAAVAALIKELQRERAG